MTQKAILNYTLHLADNALILGQRLGEWCGHGPVLEQDIALTNIALDLIGQSRMLYQYAAELEGGDATEDSMAYMRREHAYLNCLLAEQPNGHFGDTMLRQYFFDVFNYFNYSLLRRSEDDTLAAIATKSIKEVSYHLQLSSQWVVRLGDGTEESRAKMLEAVDRLWPYTGELYTPTAYEIEMAEAGIAPQPDNLRGLWHDHVSQTLAQATIPVPEVDYMQSGGKSGRHSEHMGYILADLQYMQRAYPGVRW